MTEACIICHGTEFYYRPAGILGGAGGYVCARCHPAPRIKDITKRGRRRLDIPLALICDTLKRNKDIYRTAAELNCSRAYIYREAGAAKVRELIS
ncbi:hypothetical protein ACFLVH_00555 [Chloroflexota bacterium]